MRTKCRNCGAAKAAEAVVSMLRHQPLGVFGHHPDPEIDREVEIERLEGALVDARAGLPPQTAGQDVCG